MNRSSDVSPQYWQPWSLLRRRRWPCRTCQPSWGQCPSDASRRGTDCGGWLLCDNCFCFLCENLLCHNACDYFSEFYVCLFTRLYLLRRWFLKKIKRQTHFFEKLSLMTSVMPLLPLPLYAWIIHRTALFLHWTAFHILVLRWAHFQFRFKHRHTKKPLESICCGTHEEFSDTFKWLLLCM